MAKAEIGWKGRTADGQKRDVYAQHVGKRWVFYAREQRFEQWQAIPNPPLEDWLSLLDAVRRRIVRRLQKPEEEARIRKVINERFPGVPIDE